MKLWAMAGVVGVLGWCLCTAAAAGPGKGAKRGVLAGTDWVPGELIVAFEDISAPSDIDGVVATLPAGASWQPLAHAAHARGQGEAPHPLSRVRIIRGLGNADIPAMAQAIAQLPGVAYAEPNYLARMAFAPNDPLYNQQYGPQIIQAETAWDTTTGDASVIVAIVDSGLNFGHEDFQDGAVWVNDDPPNGIDDDENGFVDDEIGWDFGHGDADPEDTDGHGSHVAGIAAARLNNGVGMAGLGNFTIMPLLVFVDGSSTHGHLAEAIYYATDNGATVINFSGGSTYDADVVREACAYAYAHGVLVVCAAGNDNIGIPYFPAAYDTTIAVSGTDANDERYGSSNYGNHMDLAAPAVNVYSAVAGGPQDYDFYTGTSMAAPHVTGVVALMYTIKPNLTPEQVRFVLRGSADDIGDIGFDPYFGYGRLNARQAIEGVINMVENTMPDTFTTMRGQLFAGGVANLFQSDNDRVTFRSRPRRSSGDAPVRVLVHATAALPNPASLEFKVEATTYAPLSIFQRIELLNYVTGQYEIVDERKAPRPDTVTTVTVTGDPARFIEPGTLHMRAQLSWRDADPQVIPNWLVGVDQAVWKITTP